MEEFTDDEVADLLTCLELEIARLEKFVDKQNEKLSRLSLLAEKLNGKLPPDDDMPF